MGTARWIARHRDPLIALLLGAGMLLEAAIVVAPPADDPVAVPDPTARALALVTSLALAVALAWRRRWPLAVLAVAAAATLSASTEPFDGPITLAAALVLAVYTAGAETRGRSAVWAALGVAGVLLATILRPATAIETPADAASLGLLVAGPWLAGVAVRERREREEVLAQRAAELERDREARATAAVAEERTRIARELHDVVAHAISVIVLQARGARRVLQEDPASAREALDAIEGAGSGALAEMRRLIGMLRSDGEAAALDPQPGLGSLDTLIGLVRDAGLAVEVSVEGRPVQLPAGIDLAAYRIVQEALTNALTHTDSARVSVLVRYGKSDLRLEIIDVGPGLVPSPHEGHGLVGMRERVRLYGGEIEAGPRPEGGFAVRARLPLGAA